jgi:exodeoxyribonuclease V alpha subunit
MKPEELKARLAALKARATERSELYPLASTSSSPSSSEPELMPESVHQILGYQNVDHEGLPVHDSKGNATIPSSANQMTVYDSHGRAKDITLNERQLEFKYLVQSGKSCVLLGAAGTGKTTCTKAAIQALIADGLPALELTHKHLPSGTPAVVPCAYTRRATQNIKRAMSADVAQNALTLHKLLEYAPVYYEVMDDSTGKMRRTMRFEPARNFMNQLSPSIRVIIIDEVSMLSVDLYQELEQATAHNESLQFIFIGDIQQLPPCFGLAILGFKILELPVVELVEVHRQALESPIIKFLCRILSGKVVGLAELQRDWQYPNEMQFIVWPKKIRAELALREFCKSIAKAYDSGAYNPEEDIILCPYNAEKSKSGEQNFSVFNINRYIANHIARANNYLTFEIIAGFQTFYYSIGDKVLYDKEDCIITAIEENPAYMGKAFQQASFTLDYWGHDPVSHGHRMQNTDLDLDKLLEMAGEADNEERTIQASHKITFQFIDSGQYLTVTSLSDLNKLDHAYALTVHKSQGSEWRKVFLALHWSHNNMIRRELLYTAISRASKQIVVICEPDTFIGGIQKQTIKGTTLAEKAEYFKGKSQVAGAGNEGAIVPCLPSNLMRHATS